MYGGQAFLIQLVELNGIDENMKYKSFVCDVKLSSHPNDRGYEEVRKDLPNVKERIKGYVRETRELDDLEKMFWRKELAFFPQSILKGHTVIITLYGISEDVDGMEGNNEGNEAENVRTILGTLELPSYYVAKLCRNNMYESLSFKVPQLDETPVAEDTKKTFFGTSKPKAGRKYSKITEKNIPNLAMNGDKMLRVNMLFSLCSAKVANVQSDVDKSSIERLRSVVSEWRRISLPTIRIVKRIAREVFGSYSSIPMIDRTEAPKLSNQQKPLTKEELLAQLKESLDKREDGEKTGSNESFAQKDVMFKRLSRSTVYSLFLSRAQFEKFAYDTYLDISTSLNIFMEHATTAFNGKYMVNFKLFKKVLKKLAKARYPSMGPFSSLKRFCYYDLRKRAKLYRGWRKVNALRFKPKIPKVLDPRFLALRKAKVRNAALTLQRSWRKRRLRIKAMNLIRRFIKRHAVRRTPNGIARHHSEND